MHRITRREALAAAAAVPFLATKPALAAPPVGKRKFALLVGVNVYNRRGFGNLEHAERDVTELKKVLTKQGYDVTLLTGKKATKAGFDSALKAIFAKKVHRNEIVLLGFAGHGFQMPLLDAKGKPQRDRRGNAMEDAYFAPVDATKGKPNSMISLTALLDTLANEGGVNLMLVDACRNDPNPGRGRSLTGNELQGRLPKNTAVLFSCAAGQEALETKLAGGGHGVFFHHVLEALNGEAKDKRGRLTWSRLVTHVRENVNDKAKQWFPDRAKSAAAKQDVDLADALVQTPHALTNLIRIPPLGAVSEEKPTMLGKKAGEVRTFSDLKIKMCWCPPGTFLMGSPKGEKGRDDDEDQVTVKLTRGFWMARTEVTQSLWKSVMGTEPWKGKGFVKEGANYPATFVSHTDAVSFCQKLTSRERKAGRLPVGWSYRLPTEAEWEYACRAGTKTAYSFGDDAAKLGDYAWYNKNAWDIDERYAHAVASKKPNAWGLYDMHGNVWEWCQDWYDQKLAGGTDPQGPEKGSGRVDRGGSWYFTARNCRSAARNGYPPSARDNDLGSRVVLSPSGQ